MSTEQTSYTQLNETPNIGSNEDKEVVNVTAPK